MGEWVIAGSLLVAAVILGKAVDNIARLVKDSGSRRDEHENLRMQLTAVSHIAGTLISAVISNPKYLALIDQLETNRVEAFMSDEDAGKEGRIKAAEELLNEKSVFYPKGREKYISLALSIYATLEKELKEIQGYRA
jgi:hypothetical protein